jgi:hypothetical protein
MACREASGKSVRIVMRGACLSTNFYFEMTPAGAASCAGAGCEELFCGIEKPLSRQRLIETAFEVRKHRVECAVD